MSLVSSGTQERPSDMTMRPDPSCYLCGRVIDHDAPDDEMQLSMDHIPPKQFFPQPLRKAVNPNLVVAASHKICNNTYKNDEEYFYHSLYPLVANTNHNMAQAIFTDLVRRRTAGQTPSLIRRIFSRASGITQGGIVLPHGRIEFTVDLARIQRIAIKIARGVLFLETGLCFPQSSVVDIRLCEKESEVPEMYQLSWQGAPIKGAYPNVFSYRYFALDSDNALILSLMFWGAFMFCITIQKAAPPA